MKKLTLLTVLILTLSFAVSVSAQHRIGFTGGLNYSKISFISNDLQDNEFSSKTFFGSGVVLDLKLSENLVLHMEPLYLQKGSEKKQIAPDPGVTLKSSYIELPVFLKIPFENSLNPYVMVGPSFGYLLSSDIEVEASGFALKGDMKPVSKKLDIGLGFGGGFDIPAGSLTFFLEGRYIFGLNNLSKVGSIELSTGSVKDNLEMESDDQYKNRGFQFMAGVTIPLSK